MDIASISGSLLSKLFDRTPASNSAPEPAAAAPASSAAPGGGRASQARDILAQYDIRNITPREFSELTQKLHQAGVITSNDLKDLSQLRMDMDLSQAGPDEPIDLLDFEKDRLEAKASELEDLKLRSPESPQAQDPDGFMAAVAKQFEWIRKFADIQSGVASPAVDQTV